MAEENQDEITELLLAWSRGNRDAFENLADAVYARLSRLASSYLRQERSDHTLNTGALVHEAFLRLIQQDRVQWRDRAHFFAISAKLMRRILVDHARRSDSSKRGGGIPTLVLDEVFDQGPLPHPDILALDDALQDLETRDSELANLVVLRYFGGLTHDEVAEVLDISLSSVARRWRTARAWLHSYLVDGGAHVL
ncbi:MAG: sigma-70 family RNA polymerase sigma factor [Deltaproteobacteria bacterium]|nr:sigma-70 family RNA polymerase sigma factor [Deltaproteobacteria bacterium]